MKRIAEIHKRFGSIYMQLSKLQSLEDVSFLEPISLDDINNQTHHKLQMDNEHLQKLGDITLLLFTNAVVQRQQHMQ